MSRPPPYKVTPDASWVPEKWQRQFAERETARKMRKTHGTREWSRMNADDVEDWSDDDLILPDQYPGRSTPPLPREWEASEEF